MMRETNRILSSQQKPAKARSSARKRLSEDYRIKLHIQPSEHRQCEEPPHPQLREEMLAKDRLAGRRRKREEKKPQRGAPGWNGHPQPPPQRQTGLLSFRTRSVFCFLFPVIIFFYFTICSTDLIHAEQLHRLLETIKLE